ncbi:hydrogenase maturation protease [Desulfoscipio geothermicus]|uniref:Hydrogenase maturation protease n=1 Tax=Desulfoscipio geothermicus DSM 3669 TaxID=1121426 RepID=A0A1I6D461_9FIRM|nr:hydrogenase maturation protease [Desulfoscipio geothermicus]SFR00269.1 hydrogenase maturation protease [Desulfoscipio geothermicus DSM 3669]
MAEIAVIGLGNPLLKDDGFGPRVIRALRSSGLPAGVQAVEAGGSFYSYWDLLLSCQHVIAVDSMLGDGPPGTVYMLSPEQLAGARQLERGLWHEIHFLDVLKMAAFFGARPEVTIVGVQPGEINFCLDLSPQLQARLPQVTKLVREMCCRLLRDSSRL